MTLGIEASNGGDDRGVYSTARATETKTITDAKRAVGASTFEVGARRLFATRRPATPADYE